MLERYILLTFRIIRAKVYKKGDFYMNYNYTGGSVGKRKTCNFCGSTIDLFAVVCPSCGRQVEEMKQTQTPNIIINNANSNTSVNADMSMPGAKNKWVAFLLCLFLGYFGAHKFYENKVGMGVLYIFTAGLFGIGWFIDLIVLLCKPNPYYV